jgi:type IV pilus assembly protein PilP
MRLSMKLALRCALVVAAAAILAGCGGDNLSDLEQYAQKIQARRAPPIKPIPEIKPYEKYIYRDENLRPPFTPPAETVVESNLRPDAHRVKEYLEQFPLDSLSMVGTITMGGVRYALIKDNSGTVYRVKRGNYLGQNDGRIVKIGDDGLKLEEIVPNGLGGYVKRETTITLATVDSKAGKS